jgi:Flp pilus assembly secretin CpaC
MSRAPSSQSLRKSLRALAFATLPALLAASGTAYALEETLTVSVDRAKVMHISRPADIVIIGNPAIADAIIQDNQTLIITGKSFGTTNLIVLDSAGQPIAEELVTVRASDDNVVTIYKRAERESFSCSPDCGPILVVGDRPAVFDALNSQIQTHNNSASEGAAK